MITELKNILVVEDNADDEKLTLRALRQCDVPNMVRLARDGTEALEYMYGDAAGDYLPDLVLLDLKLPKIGGLELLKRMRSEPRTQFMVIVVLTSSDEESDIVKSYQWGANSYVRKPVDFEEFMDAVRELGVYWLSMNHAAPGPYSG